MQGVADEGGYWPAFASNEEALDMLVRAIETAGFTPGDEVAISLDVAASEFGSERALPVALEKRELDRDGMIELLGRWIENYPIVSIEDPFAEDDPEGFRGSRRLMAAACRSSATISSSRMRCKSRRRLRPKLATRSSSSPIRPGRSRKQRPRSTRARQHGMGTIVSARSGETEDVTIAHLAVGWDAGQFKVGSFTRSERMAKWNEVLRIEEKLGAEARLAVPFRS